MKVNLTYFLGFCVVLFGARISPVWGQQSLFNVPSLSVTMNNRVFFQEQLNMTKDGLTCNLNTAYGLGRNFEVGLNFTSLNIVSGRRIGMLNLTENDSNFTAQPAAPLVMVTGLKVFELSERLKIGLGTESGTNILASNADHYNFALFTYGGFVYRIPKAKLNLMAGGFWGNKVAIGIKNELGFLLGYEWEVVDEKLFIMGDWIGASRSVIGVMVHGLVWFVTGDVALSLGVQFPDPRTINPYGVVFELTIF